MIYISYIIPLCNLGDEDFNSRLKSLNYYINTFLRNQKGVTIELIIVEQVVDKNLSTYRSFINSSTIKIINVSYPIFNKGWLINIGVKNSSYNNIIVSDVDTICRGKTYLKDFIKYINSNSLSWCIGWKKIFYLSLESKENLFYTNKLVLNDYERYSRVTKGGAEGGIVYFKKEFLVSKLGGYNELFQELGGIDNEIIRRAEFLTKSYNVFSRVLIHLWHKVTIIKHGYFRSTNQLMNKYTSIRPYDFIKFLLLYEKAQDKPLSDNLSISNVIELILVENPNCSAFCMKVEDLLLKLEKSYELCIQLESNKFTKISALTEKLLDQKSKIIGVLSK